MMFDCFWVDLLGLLSCFGVSVVLVCVVWCVWFVEVHFELIWAFCCSFCKMNLNFVKFFSKKTKRNRKKKKQMQMKRNKTLLFVLVLVLVVSTVFGGRGKQQAFKKGKGKGKRNVKEDLERMSLLFIFYFP